MKKINLMLSWIMMVCMVLILIPDTDVFAEDNQPHLYNVIPGAETGVEAVKDNDIIDVIFPENYYRNNTNWAGCVGLHTMGYDNVTFRLHFTGTNTLYAHNHNGIKVLCNEGKAVTGTKVVFIPDKGETTINIGANYNTIKNPIGIINGSAELLYEGEYISGKIDNTSYDTFESWAAKVITEVTSAAKAELKLKAVPKNTYTLVVPTKTTGISLGFYELSGGLKIQDYDVESDKKVTVSASSENEWKLKSGESEISYVLKESESSQDFVTVFDFTEDKTINVGIEMNEDEYIEAVVCGEYTDIITWTSQIE